MLRPCGYTTVKNAASTLVVVMDSCVETFSTRPPGRPPWSVRDAVWKGTTSTRWCDEAWNNLAFMRTLGVPDKTWKREFQKEAPHSAISSLWNESRGQEAKECSTFSQAEGKRHVFLGVFLGDRCIFSARSRSVRSSPLEEGLFRHGLYRCQMTSFFLSSLSSSCTSLRCSSAYFSSRSRSNRGSVLPRYHTPHHSYRTEETEMYCTCRTAIYSPWFALQSLAEEPSIPPYSRWYVGRGSSNSGGRGSTRSASSPAVGYSSSSSVPLSTRTATTTGGVWHPHAGLQKKESSVQTPLAQRGKASPSCMKKCPSASFSFSSVPRTGLEHNGVTQTKNEATATPSRRTRSRPHRPLVPVVLASSSGKGVFSPFCTSPSSPVIHDSDRTRLRRGHRIPLPRVGEQTTIPDVSSRGRRIATLKEWSQSTRGKQATHASMRHSSVSIEEDLPEEMRKRRGGIRVCGMMVPSSSSDSGCLQKRKREVKKEEETYYCQCCFKRLSPTSSLYTSLYQPRPSPAFWYSPFSSASRELSWGAKASTAVSSVVDILRATGPSFFASSSASSPAVSSSPTLITADDTTLKATPPLPTGGMVLHDGEASSPPSLFSLVPFSSVGFHRFSMIAPSSRTSERLRVLLRRIGPLLRLAALHKSSSKKSAAAGTSSSTTTTAGGSSARDGSSTSFHPHKRGAHGSGVGGRLKALFSVGLEIGAQIHRATSSSSTPGGTPSSSPFYAASSGGGAPLAGKRNGTRYPTSNDGAMESSSRQGDTARREGKAEHPSRTTRPPPPSPYASPHLDLPPPSAIRPTRVPPLVKSSFFPSNTPASFAPSTSLQTSTAASFSAASHSFLLSVGTLTATLGQRHSLFTLASDAVRYAVAVYGRAYEEGFLHALRSGVLLFAHPTYQALHYLPTRVQMTSVARLLHVKLGRDTNEENTRLTGGKGPTTPVVPSRSTRTTSGTPITGTTNTTTTPQEPTTNEEASRRSTTGTTTRTAPRLGAAQDDVEMIAAHYHTDDVRIGSTYVICVDHRLRRFIVAFRGTSTLSDALCAVKDGYARITLTLPTSAAACDTSITKDCDSQPPPHHPAVPQEHSQQDEKERVEVGTVEEVQKDAPPSVHRIHTRVPLGFYQLTLTHASTIIATLQTLALSYPSYEVLLTGHSLGAIQASLFHVLCCLPYPTFGRDPTTHAPIPLSRRTTTTPTPQHDKQMLELNPTQGAEEEKQEESNTNGTPNVSSCIPLLKTSEDTLASTTAEKTVLAMKPTNADTRKETPQEENEEQEQELPHLFTRVLSSTLSEDSTEMKNAPCAPSCSMGTRQTSTASPVVQISGIHSVCFAPAPFLEKDAAVRLAEWLTTVEQPPEGHRTQRTTWQPRVPAKHEWTTTAHHRRRRTTNAPFSSSLTEEKRDAAQDSLKKANNAEKVEERKMNRTTVTPAPVSHRMLCFCYGEDLVPRLQIRALRAFILDEEVGTEELYDEAEDWEKSARKRSSTGGSSPPWYTTLLGANPFRGLREAAARRLAAYPPHPLSTVPSSTTTTTSLSPPLSPSHHPISNTASTLPVFYIPGLLFFLSPTAACGGLAPSMDLDEPARRRLHLLFQPSSSYEGHSHGAAGSTASRPAWRQKTSGSGKSDSTMDVLRHHLPKCYVHRILAEQQYYAAKVKERTSRCAVAF